MSDLNFLEAKHQWDLLEWFGIYHPFLKVTAPTLIATWVVIGLIIVSIIACRLVLSYKKNIFQHALLFGAEAFMDLCSQTLGMFHYGHFSFLITLFIFILYCNLMGVVPFLEEPTGDLNTTIALGTISFLYVNYYAIKVHGIKNYTLEYFKPFFLMLPLNIMSKFSSILSISFRLFGNLMGGSIITAIYMNQVGQFPSAWYFAWIPLAGSIGSVFISVFFGIFESFIQAFVFAMLSLTYLSLETKIETD